jgi:HD-GYP domain-containing protein (c-di-GMP phosphodiesterase class II)
MELHRQIAPPLNSQKTVYQLIKLIVAAVHCSRLYAESHPQVIQYVKKAFRIVSHLLREKTALTLLIIDQNVVVDDRRLPNSSPYQDKFVRILSDKSIERLTFEAGLTLRQFHRLVRNLASDAPLPSKAGSEIKLGRVLGPAASSPESEPAPTARPKADDIREIKDLGREKIETLKALYDNIEKHQNVDVADIENIVREFIRRFRQDINPLTLLASVKSSNEYTFTHVVNVCILTMFIAETLGFTGEILHNIGVAASLHDTGKLFIPEDILNKPGRLTPEERRIVEQHPQRGAQYLMNLEGIPKLAIICCLEHHLRFDGGGYPAMPKSYRPHIVSQMISIADVFDAMRSRRVYQEARSLDTVVRTIRSEKAKAFNPHLVDHFLKLIGS